MGSTSFKDCDCKEGRCRDQYGFCVRCDSPELLIAPPCVVISKYGFAACALFTAVSKVKCWGECSSGVCGAGQYKDIGDDAGEMGSNLKFVDLGDFPVKSISMGSYFACALSKMGKVKCWGVNQNGVLGSGTSRQDWSLNFPEVDLGTNARVVQLSAGSYHVCVLLDNNSVKCWGAGDRGQLGYGNRNNYGDSLETMRDNLPTVDLWLGEVLQLWAFHQSSCVQMSSGKVKCWGHNWRGALGTERPDDLTRAFCCGCSAAPRACSAAPA
ncbi:regulator of chromosome condensation 1/beta-lactamase-inhibitor protein II [Baffinella frigidus]|nr:regulator of chromosome condensation 1/beta-lactamase-inhibitor protein II [Cryptophyta sp. CCMP2293]